MISGHENKNKDQFQEHLLDSFYDHFLLEIGFLVKLRHQVLPFLLQLSQQLLLGIFLLLNCSDLLWSHLCPINILKFFQIDYVLEAKRFPIMLLV